MKHFNAVIVQLTAMHKDANTVYAPEKMFSSSMDLSFAISRLHDAEKVFTSERLDNKEITPELRDVWFEIRDDMPKDVSQNLAICIINNTPLSKTSKEIDAIEKLFYNAIYDFTDNEQLSQAFTEIFFSSVVEQKLGSNK